MIFLSIPQGSLGNLFRYLKEKEDELDQLEGDPARFTLLQLLSFVNDDEKTVPIPALTVNGAIRETPTQTDFDKQHQR